MRKLKKGSSNVKVIPKEKVPGSDVVKIRTVDEGKQIKLTSRKKYGRYDAMYINRDGNFQYLVAYNPGVRGSVYVVRSLLKPLPLPSMTTPPSAEYQGDIIEFKLYYLDEEGEFKMVTYDARGPKYKSAFKRCFERWDKIAEKI